MYFLDLIWAFLLAWLFVILLTGPMRWRHPSQRDSGATGAAIFLFIIFFLAIWAGGLWLPFGPMIAGVYWLPFLLIGLFILLLIAAVTPPPPRPRTPEEAKAEAEESEAAGTAMGVFFWILVIGMVIAIVVAYAR